MAKEYIPREDVINDIGELFTICRETYPNECGHHFIVENELQSHLDFVRNLPAADVVARDCYDRLLAENDRLREERPVTHGYWKRERNGFLYCSVCEAVSPAEDMYEEYIVCPKYCHVCGSVMDMKGAESDE